MQTASVPKERATDTTTTILNAMRQMGVVGLPRNYEIFYEALTGSNQALAMDLVSLSKRPSQQELDELGRKYFTQNHGLRVVDQAREIIARELEDVASLLRNERNSLEKYEQILNETSDGLSSRSLITKDILEKIASVMSVATASTIDQGRQLASTLGEKSAELETVKSKLEEYKRLADTDGLTQLWNRRSFDKEMARIYNSPRGIMFNALILVDIDRFKDINDRFGHPVGDRILQTIALILQSSVRNDAFVARTGGEEFAIVVEGATEEVTATISERIRAAVAQHSFANPQTGVSYGPVSISIGICMASQADGAEDLYAKADRALYRSKVAGRDRVTRFSALTDNRAGKNWMLYKSE